MKDPYEALVAEYVDELKLARGEAEAWWSALQSAVGGEGASAERERRKLSLRWPCGPVSHPRVLGVFRKYFLRCDAMNEELRNASAELAAAREREPITESDWGRPDEELDEPRLLEPRFVLIERVGTLDADLGDFINGLVFVPVGMDAQGEAV